MGFSARMLEQKGSAALFTRLTSVKLRGDDLSGVAARCSARR